MKALEERKKAPNPFKIAKDKEIEPQKEKNKDDLEESAQKISEEQQDPVANQEIPEDQESSKMPENKKELLQKIDRMIFKAKENQAKEKKKKISS
jgi:hypothetical protein